MNNDNNQKNIEITKKIQDSRKNPILILDLKEINKNVLLDIHNILCEKQFDELDVVLQTPGGNIDAAYLIAKLIKNKAKKLNIIVPLFAKSAGTLICLIADKILLTDLSELGPLDTQIFEQEEGGQSGYKSALNGFKGLEQIQQHTIETLDVVVKLLLSRSRMKISEAINLASQFTGQTSGTLYSQLNPYRIGEYARALEIGERYAITILTRYKNWQENEATIIVKKLVKGYPYHGYIIDYEELEELGLPAEKIEKSLLKDILSLRKSLLESKKTFIKLLENNNIQKYENKELADKNSEIIGKQ